MKESLYSKKLSDKIIAIRSGWAARARFENHQS
jgi:hypothetical protein